MASVAERVARRYLRMRGFTSRDIPTSVGTAHVLEAEGTGRLPPLVLLHGFGASGVQMLPILVRLQKHSRRLLVPDLPGHGFSEVPEGGAPSAALRAGLLETLDQIVDEPMVLFGNSMGGFAAISYATERPEHVSNLILCSPGGARMAQHELDEFRTVFQVDSHKDALEFVDRLLGRRSPFRHAIALSVRRRMATPHLQALMASVTPEDLLLPDHLEALSMPILMVWGENDGILPEHNRDFFRTHLPEHAEVVEPAHLGHSPYLESPGALTQLIVRFLDGGRATEAAAARAPDLRTAP